MTALCRLWLRPLALATTSIASPGPSPTARREPAPRKPESQSSSLARVPRSRRPRFSANAPSRSRAASALTSARPRRGTPSSATVTPSATVTSSRPPPTSPMSCSRVRAARREGPRARNAHPPRTPVRAPLEPVTYMPNRPPPSTRKRVTRRRGQGELSATKYDTSMKLAARFGLPVVVASRSSKVCPSSALATLVGTACRKVAISRVPQASAATTQTLRAVCRARSRPPRSLQIARNRANRYSSMSRFSSPLDGLALAISAIRLASRISPKAATSRGRRKTAPPSRNRLTLASSPRSSPRAPPHAEVAAAGDPGGLGGQPLLEVDLGPVAEQRLGPGAVRAGVPGVAGPAGLVDELDPAPADLADQVEDMVQGHPAPAADVDRLGVDGRVHGEQVGADHVGHVGEVAGLLAVAVHGDRPAAVDGFEEAPEAHVGALAWAVHGEVAQRGHGQRRHRRIRVGEAEMLAGEHLCLAYANPAVS